MLRCDLLQTRSYLLLVLSSAPAASLTAGRPCARATKLAIALLYAVAFARRVARLMISAVGRGRAALRQRVLVESDVLVRGSHGLEVGGSAIL